MIRIFQLLAIMLVTISAYAQNAQELYRKADTLFRQKDYSNAALAFGNGIRTEGAEASIVRYRSAAAAWALSGMPDSAFYYLDQVAMSSKTNKVVARNIENGPDFFVLTNDKRWKPMVKRINIKATDNGYPQQEYIYGRKDGVGLTMINIKPKVPSNGKAIISVQSGGWVSGYNGIEIQTVAMEQYLSKGFQVFAVMHASSPRYAIPDAVNDLKRAVRFLRFHADSFGIDPNRIGITGGSAGGHLSLVIATADDNINPLAPDPIDRVSSRVQAVAILYPPTDFLNWGMAGANMINAKELLMSRSSWGFADFRVLNDKTNLFDPVTDTTERNKIARNISPVYAVTPDDPPVFIVHGDADPTVPLQQSQSIITKMNEAGVVNRLVIKKGGKHNPQDMMPEWNEFAEWFERYLK